MRPMVFYPCNLRNPRFRLLSAVVRPVVTASSRESRPESFGDMNSLIAEPADAPNPARALRFAVGRHWRGSVILIVRPLRLQ